MEPTKERIEKEADEFAFMVPYDGTENFYDKGKYEGYIAGATSEHERAQQELQAYRDIIKELLPIAEMMQDIFEGYGKLFPSQNTIAEHNKTVLERAKKLIDTVTLPR